MTPIVELQGIWFISKGFGYVRRCLACTLVSSRAPWCGCCGCAHTLRRAPRVGLRGWGSVGGAPIGPLSPSNSMAINCTDLLVYPSKAKKKDFPFRLAEKPGATVGRDKHGEGDTGVADEVDELADAM